MAVTPRHHTVLLLAPVWMQLIHLLMADALWIALVLLGAEVLRRTSGTARDTSARAVTMATRA